jgi:hypothetical protein
MTTPASDDTPTSEWWDEIRVTIAFLVAPSVVPLILAVHPSSFGLSTAVAPVIAVALVVSYVATGAFGAPLYLLLRAQNVTAFVIAPAAGLIAGMIVMSMLPGGFVSSSALQFGALTGAAVGAVLWLIARPDRPARPAPGEQGGGAG